MAEGDEQLAARRAQTPVYCGACGTEYPGDTTALNNGLCYTCRGPNYRLIRKVARYEKALHRIAFSLWSFPGADRIQQIARDALKEDQ